MKKFGMSCLKSNIQRGILTHQYYFSDILISMHILYPRTCKRMMSRHSHIPSVSCKCHRHKNYSDIHYLERKLTPRICLIGRERQSCNLWYLYKNSKSRSHLCSECQNYRLCHHTYLWGKMQTFCTKFLHTCCWYILERGNLSLYHIRYHCIFRND